MAGHYALASGNPSGTDLYVPQYKDDPRSDNNVWPEGAAKPQYGTYGSNYSNPSLNPPSSPIGQSDEHIPLNQRGDAYNPTRFKVEADTGYAAAQKSSGKKRKIMIIGALVALLLLIAAVIIPVYFFVIKPNTNSAKGNGSAAGSNGGDSSSAPQPSQTGTDRPARLTRGGNGSEVTMSNGTTFTYVNSFGGTWVHDPQDPFNLDAQANSWTPPLNTTWRWGVDRVFGVNLGGWFVLEPFINPGIFQRYPGAVDEYTLTELMRAEGEAGGPGLRALEEHYETFITEEDIAEIAAAGLNWLRVPIGYWAIETYEGEPFLERTSWTYFLRVVEWSRKYGLRIYLDLHALPGSQNAMNHSARLRRLGFLHGNMGIANAQRTLYYLRVLAEFVSQPEYKDVIPMLGFVNEPDSRPDAIGQDPLRSFYLEAYTIIREATGYGEGNGPYLVFGDGFRSTTEWEGFMPGADRLVMDIHPYLAFDDNNQPDPLDVPAPDGELGGVWPLTACTRWGQYFNSTKRMHGITIGGEFSAAINDCGLYIREVGMDSSHPLCELYNAWEDWDDNLKEGLRNFILASFDAIGDFFWWTWRIGDSIDGRVTAPFWSYKLGRQHGWMPTDPRTSVGKCLALGLAQDPFDGNFEPRQTGAVPSPTIDPVYAAAYPWPPTALANLSVDISLLPTYTNTAPIITMPVPTYSGAPSQVTASVDGWFNDQDTLPGATPIAGCEYPHLYDGEFLGPLPTEPCS